MHPQLKTVEAVLFDAGGVLLLPDPTVIGPLLAPYGADPSVESLTRAHYAAMRTQDFEGEVHDDWRDVRPRLCAGSRGARARRARKRR